MNKLHLPNFNLHISLLGGQAFCWDYFREDNAYIGVTNSRVIKIKVVNSENILWQTYPQKDDFEFLKEYLRLDDDYISILNSLPNDEHMIKAKEKYPNLRLLNQDFEQTLLSYICSSTKSILGIRQCTRLLSKKYGEKIVIDSEEYSLFPRAEVLAETSIEQILETKVGFRGKYLIEGSKRIVRNEISKDSTREELKTINGVGDKIADCVMVYSLKNDNITPLDIWGKRFLTKYYNLNENMKYEDMSKWATKYFNGYAAWGGQFLFEYIRNQKN